MSEHDADLDALVAREKESMARDVSPPTDGLARVRRAAEAAPRWKALRFVGKLTVVAIVVAAMTVAVRSRREPTAADTPVHAPTVSDTDHPAEARSPSPVAPTATAIAGSMPAAATPQPATPATGTALVPDAEHEQRSGSASTRAHGDAVVPDTAAQSPALPAAADVTDAPPSDTLAEELALLRAAQAAFRAGDSARALALAGEHAQRFPAGALAPERRALERRVRCRDATNGATRPEDCP